MVLHKLYSSTLCGISVLPLLSLKEVDVDVDVLYRIIPQHGSSCEEWQNVDVDVDGLYTVYGIPQHGSPLRMILLN